ncbi:MAG TPA: hypothetical protein VE976_04075 [Actinomycetota bacterium]|nr:hypothetical protein [Actinomycetota bacterium]
MSSAARSPEGGRAGASVRPREDEVLAGPISVCVDRPVLSLDRPFTYELADELGAGIGSLVQVPLHGRRVRGWVLGPTEDVPPKMLPVGRVVSTVRFFDPPMLDLFRWVAERYVAPLASVIARSHPPRVASEESMAGGSRPTSVPRVPRNADDPRRRARYRGWGELADALGSGAGEFVVRPALGDAVESTVAIVAETLVGGRTALVLVADAEPQPATSVALREAFGDAVGVFLGGDERARYRTWLEIQAGRYRVVVGTRAAVFAPLDELGAIVVTREHHALYREERSPYHHVRNVAVARARLAGAVCVLSSVAPSLEALAVPHLEVAPVDRSWPPVEVVRPGPEGRAPRLVRALQEARRAFVYEPVPGYGVARVCKACEEPATCGRCRGTLRASRGEVRCVVCGAEGRCANCGGTAFGVVRGGRERVVEWVSRVAPVPVSRSDPGASTSVPQEGVLVGGLEALRDDGVGGLDLVAIVHADASLRRPGLSARQQALTAWMEAVSWADARGRVIVQTDHANDPAIQALVGGRVERFARSEAARLDAAGFPVGAAVFRVEGTSSLEGELDALGPRTLLRTSLGERTVCLLALDPADVPRFSRAARALAARGVVTRVVAEPHL